MKNITKIWLIIAFSLMVLGATVFAVSVSLNGGLEMKKYLTKTYDNLSEFNDIYINDMSFLTSTSSQDMMLGQDICRREVQTRPLGQL